MAIPKPLTCRISRPIKGRFILNKDQISELYQKVSECFEVSLEYEANIPREQLSKWALPSLEVELSDGSLYKDTRIEMLDQIYTDRNRVIERIEMSSRYGYFTSSIKISNKNTSIANRIDAIIVDGPEEKAVLFYNNVERIIKSNTDLTSYIYNLSSFFISSVIYVFVSYLLITIFFQEFLLRFLNSPIYIVGPSILAVFSLSFPIIITIEYLLIDYFRNKYLKKYAFLWGQDASLHRTVYRVCWFFVVSMPAGIVINLISDLI